MAERTPERTIVQLVLVDETGDSYYRMRWPGAQLTKQDPSLRVINLDAQAKERFRLSLEADLLVLIQNSDLDLLPIIEERRRQGKATLVEYNDNFYDPPAWSPVAEPWSSPLLWQTYEIFMRAGDMLLVTGPGLQELFSPQTKVPIQILENHFPQNLPPFVWQEPGAQLRIAWAGSLGHMADLLAVQPVLKQLIDESPHVIISLMGNESIPEVLHLPEGRFEFTNWGGMQEYLNFLSRAQIGIAPMLETGYNRCRSDIKAIEFTATRTLPVLQRALPYQKFLDHTGVPSFSDNRELLECLRELVRNPEKIREHLEQAYHYVATERVDSKREERLLLYREKMDHLPPSTFNWPLPVGYHEVKGTTEPEAVSAQNLKALQQLINAGNREAALEKLKELVARNPGHPDLQLALFKLTLRQERARAQDLYPLFRRQFPRDIRFTLSLLATEAERARCEALLEEIRIYLTKLPLRSRDIFKREILTVLKNKTLQGVISSPELEPFLELLPRTPELELLIAELYEREGEHQKSAALYERITLDFLIAESYDSFRKTASYGFLSAWTEGLKGRRG